MSFKKSVPERPPITSEREFVEWFLEYSDECLHLRDFFPKRNLNRFIVSSTKMIMSELSKNPSGDALFDYVGKMSEKYETNITPMIEKHGGLQNCPEDILLVAIGYQAFIMAGIQFLLNKYHHQDAIDLYTIQNTV